MRYSENGFENLRGQRIFSCCWQPEGEVLALVVLLHGYAEHSGRYGHVADRLTRAGIAVYALDHHGHGKSEGRRAHVRDFNHYIDDVAILVEKTRAERGTPPLFLLGHSMGGAISLKCALTFPDRLSGILVSGAALELRSSTPAFLQRVAPAVAALIPLLPVEPLDSRRISRDPEVVRKYDEDPLVYHGKVRARLGAQMLAAGREILADLPQLHLPFWTGHGTDDQLVDPTGSEQLYHQAASTDKTLRLYNGLYHEILNEPEREIVIEEITAWIRKRA